MCSNRAAIIYFPCYVEIISRDDKKKVVRKAVYTIYVQRLCLLPYLNLDIRGLTNLLLTVKKKYSYIVTKYTWGPQTINCLTCFINAEYILHRKRLCPLFYPKSDERRFITLLFVGITKKYSWMNTNDKMKVLFLLLQFLSCANIHCYIAPKL